VRRPAPVRVCGGAGALAREPRPRRSSARSRRPGRSPGHPTPEGVAGPEAGRGRGTRAHPRRRGRGGPRGRRALPRPAAAAHGRGCARAERLRAAWMATVAPLRILAIDYGEKRLGLAVSDEGGVFAFPAGTLERRGRAADLAGARERAPPRGRGGSRG